MVAQSMVGHPQVVMRHDLQGEISEGLSDGEGVLAGLDRAVMVPHLPKISAHIGGDPPQPRLVVEGLGEGCSLAEVVEHLPDFSECTRAHSAGRTGGRWPAPAWRGSPGDA